MFDSNRDRWLFALAAGLIGGLIGGGVIAGGLHNGNAAEWLGAVGSVGAWSVIYGQLKHEVDRRQAAEQRATWARLTARIEMWQELPGTYDREPGTAVELIIENLGPGDAHNVDYAPLGTNAIDKHADYRPRTLLATEREQASVTMSFGDPSPLTVRLTWTDGRGRQERTMELRPEHRSR